jgi:hypothetical protein
MFDDRTVEGLISNLLLAARRFSGFLSDHEGWMDGTDLDFGVSKVFSTPFTF